jgi:6-phosphogluconolactonase
MNGRVKRFATAAELRDSATCFIVQSLNNAVTRSGRAAILLSGGFTPKAVYELLASDQYRSQIDWQNVHLFWGDERCVPPTHAESNYRMVYETLMRDIPIPQMNIHRIHAELAPAEAAELYEQEIRTFFQLREGELPRFDVVLLGIGEDGHTASLFPATRILNEAQRLVADVFVPKLNAHRVSVTYPVINNSHEIIFLVSGVGKADILRKILQGEPQQYPAQRVIPANGNLCWFIDEDAASLLR